MREIYRNIKELKDYYFYYTRSRFEYSEAIIEI